MSKRKGSIIEGIWRAQWNGGKITFERYRQIRLKMQRQWNEIQRLKKQAGETMDDETEILARIILARKNDGTLVLRPIQEQQDQVAPGAGRPPKPPQLGSTPRPGANEEVKDDC